MSTPQDQPSPQTERRVARRRMRRVPRPFKVDHRSGFDRRASCPGGPLTRGLRRLRDSRHGLAAVLVSINALNVLDLLLTLRLLGDGSATEGNPVMRALIGNDPLIALFVKVALVALVSLGIWRQRRYRMILGLAVIFLVAFSVLTLYELALVSGA
jgi:hypothetical protein